jgi:hypothetical protein
LIYGFFEDILSTLLTDFSISAILQKKEMDIILIPHKKLTKKIRAKPTNNPAKQDFGFLLDFLELFWSGGVSII